MSRFTQVASRSRAWLSAHLSRASEASRAAVQERGETMRATESTTKLGTRKRAFAPMIAGVATLGVLFAMVGSNVMAVNFTTSNYSYKVYTDRIVGQYAAGYLGAQEKTSGKTPVLHLGVKTADLYGLCAIATDSLPGGVGDVSIVITGGEKVDGNPTSATPIKAADLFLAGDSVMGNGENIETMTLGQAAETLQTAPGQAYPGGGGDFGLQAKLLQIKDLDADSYGIDLAGNINLPDLKIRVMSGIKTKSACTS